MRQNGRERDLKPLIYDLPRGFSREAFDAKIAEIRHANAELLSLERAIIDQRTKIETLWATLPPGVNIREERMCTYDGCYKLTLDRFGGKPFCHRHIRGNAGILDALIHGDE